MDFITTFQLLGNFGEFVGAIAVVATLVYLALQIRQSSEATKVQAVQSVQQSMIDISIAMASDESWAHIMEKTPNTWLDLSFAERIRVGWLWFAVMRGSETLYHHYLRGNADYSIWEPYERSIMTNLRMVGFRAWWRSNTYPFTKEFTDFVDAKLVEVEAEGKPYNWFADPAD